MKALTLPVYNLSGTSESTTTLKAAVFGVQSNPTLIHQALIHFLANRRAPFAHTKDRSQVSGSGKKPWKQKGTGNARAGSTRSPLWRGGGVTFGPTSARNYSVRMPHKMRQAAFRMILSNKVAEDNLIVLSSLAELDGKTKSWVGISQKLPKASVKTLIVDDKNQALADRAIRNIPTQKYVGVEGLTIYDLLHYPVVILTSDALTALTERLAPQTINDATKTTDNPVKPTKKATSAALAQK